MALQLFEIDGGFSDSRINYLSGDTEPSLVSDGTVIAFMNDAPIGSQFVAADTGITYQKTQNTGVPGVDYALAVSPSDKLIKDINQVAHGFVVGEWLRFDPAGDYSKALGDVADNSDVVGIVESVSGVDDFTICVRGYSDVAKTGTDGTALFLDQVTAGGDTTTKPNTGIQKNLGFIANNLVYVAIDITIEISSDEAPGVPLIIVDAITTIQNVDTALVDDFFSIVWELVCSDDVNAKREAYLIQATHDGTTGADAVNVKHNRFSWLKPNGKIDGLAIGVILNGVGAAQEMRLTVAATNTTNVRMRRIAA